MINTLCFLHTNVFSYTGQHRRHHHHPSKTRRRVYTHTHNFFLQGIVLYNCTVLPGILKREVMEALL